MTRKEIGLIDEDLTYRIRGAVYEVYKQLGGGFLESVYEKSLMAELIRVGLQAERQVPFTVSYKDQPVGKFLADIVVEKSVVIELKAQANINMSMCKAQLVNYLKVSGLKVGLIVNFTYPKARVERIVV
ncbi:MAG: GxxExxY protein [Desulfobulbaceae bacterium]|jgi:GxxExxY protein|nr:GxxExxY protein [Desulfobulbaceae bacterium]